MCVRALLPAFLLSLCLMVVASTAGAVQILPTPHSSEHDLTQILSATGYSKANSFTQLNANQTLADTFSPFGAETKVKLLIEDAGYRNHNELGIYSVLDNSLTAVLFSGSASAPSTSMLSFGAGGLEQVNGSSVSSGFGSEFGFYLKNDDEGFTWYSETDRNSDGYEHFVAFMEGGKLWGGFEDLDGGGDEDFNDLVFKMRGIREVRGPAVPEPTGALLFGVGLVLAARSSRRAHARS